MTIHRPFIAVDWGTTRMRAILCDPSASGAVQKIESEGIANLRKSPAATLFSAIEPWTSKLGKPDLLLGGMVGSNIGWRETPYLECPLEFRDLAKALVTFDESGHRISIVPGVSCTNPLGQYDVMRGEEIQVLGWIRSNIKNRNGILCLPGTHTKWVKVRDGRIECFMTSVTGELYALLVKHSVLVPGTARQSSHFDVTSFARGVDVAARHSGHLLSILFSARTHLLKDPLFADSSPSYLSGLLVGMDVLSAVKILNVASDDVQVIGAPVNCQRFALALEQVGCKNSVYEGDDMVLAGFHGIAEAIQ